jgi:hypothetical protein
LNARRKASSVKTWSRERMENHNCQKMEQCSVEQTTIDKPE